MSKSNYQENQVVEATFGTGSVTPASNLYVSLHTADPGEAGTQPTNEATYGGYARQPIAANTGWTIVNDNAVNAADINFPEATSGSETATHFAIGQNVSGAGEILYFGALSSSVAVSTGVTVKITAGNLSVTEG
jgi:hypothetical protein